MKLHRVSFFLTLTATLAQAQPSGEWVHHDNGGVVVSQGGSCVAQKIDERRYLLQPSNANPASLVGIYAAVTHYRWLLHARADCTIEAETPASLYIMNRTWNLDVVPRGGGSYSAHATFNSCIGSFCKGKGVYRSDFDVALMLQGPTTLVDPGDGGELARAEFKPLVEVRRKSFEAAKSFLDKLQRLKQSDISSFVAKHVDPALIKSTGSENADSLLRKYYFERLKEGGAYEILEAYQMEAKAALRSPRLLFITAGHAQNSGGPVRETLLLVWTDDGWRLNVLQ